MRLSELLNQNIDHRVASVLTELDELKTAQYTSQNSGMLGFMNTAANSDDNGDILAITRPSGTTTSSLIPVVSTGSLTSGYGATFNHTFIPKTDRPCLATPMIEMEVKTGGLTGKSSYFVDGTGGHFGVQLNVFNGNTQVGKVQILQSAGDLFVRSYNANYRYTWRSVATVSATQAFSFSIKFKVRSSAKGSTQSAVSLVR